MLPSAACLGAKEPGTACGSSIATPLGGETFSLVHISATELQSDRLLDPTGAAGLGPVQGCAQGSAWLPPHGGTQRGRRWVLVFGWAVAKGGKTTHACGARPAGAFLARLGTGVGVLP